VGTLDSLMALSDELHKVDTTVESVTRKIANQLFDVVDDPSNQNKSDTLAVSNNNIETYLTFFKWDEAKYPISQSLKTLTEGIQAQVAKYDEELKQKSTEYNNLVHQINAEERKLGGNLLIKDLSDIVKTEHVIETEYLASAFVAVPKTQLKLFLSSYEKLTEYVLPRSAVLVSEDNEYALYRVVLFKRVVDDFKNAARDKKFIVRDYKHDTNVSAKSDKKKLENEREKMKKVLVRWCKTNFSETFIAWIHLKAIRVFVESVLRYGLPTNFQAMLLLPHKGKATKLRKVLSDLYGHLSSKAVFSAKEEEEGPGHGSEVFYPYVSLDINLDFRSNKSAGF